MLAQSIKKAEVTYPSAFLITLCVIRSTELLSSGLPQQFGYITIAFCLSR